MERIWTVTDSMGNPHQIMFKRGAFGGAKCIVDGDTYKMKSKNWVIWMADHQISIPGAECNLVVIGNKIRLAVNGTYLEDGAPYEPIRNIPAWLNVLVVVNAVIGVFMFGMIGLAVNVLLALLTFKLSLGKKNMPAMIIQIALLVIMLLLTVAAFIAA